MGSATAVVQTVYGAFGRGDVPGILAHCAPQVDWELVGPAKLGYTGKRRDHAGIADFFAKVGQFDDIQVFEPREFIEDGENVVVLGWEKTTAKDTGKPFESEWVHVFTVKGGKVTRWRGFFDTAARYPI
jgi:ketosteroid isomerase-like protein